MRIFALLLLLFSLAAEASVQLVRPFYGQKVKSSQGGFYVDIKLTHGIDLKSRPGKIQVDLYSEKEGRFYTFNHLLGSNTEKVNESWILPIGRYRVVKLSTTDASGQYLQWYSKRVIKKIYIKSKTMSNLGIWNLSRRGTKFLSAIFSSCPNVLDLHNKKYFGFNEVIDGFSQARQSYAVPPSPIIP